LAQIDIFLTTENNLAWHKLLTNDRLHERMRGWWESLHMSTAHNTTDKNTGTYQPGGVGVFCINQAAHRIQMAGPDPSGLGRFCWMVLKGQENKLLRIVTAYRPSKSNNGHLLVSQQHWQHFSNQNPDQTGQLHPQKKFWVDLKPLLKAWMEAGEQIIVGIDVNKHIGHLDIITFFSKFGMIEAITNQHSLDAPLTHQLGSHAIDGLFINPSLLGHQCSYLGGLDRVTGNHHALWLDLLEQWLFGGSMPTIVRAGAHHLKSNDPRMHNSYLKHLVKFFEEHLILQKSSTA